MTTRAEDALLDLVNEKNRIIEALEQQLVGHGIPPTLLPAPTESERTPCANGQTSTRR